MSKKTDIGPAMKLPETFAALSTEQLEQFTKLKPITQRFIIEYLADQNATAAAARAGFSKKTAHVLGCRQLKKVKPLIDALLDAQKIHLAVKCGISRDRWLQEIQRLAFYDPRKFFDVHGNSIPVAELPEEQAVAVAGFKITEEFNGRGEDRESVGYTKEFKLADKLSALTLFGKATGYYTEDIPLRDKSPLEQASTAALLSLLNKIENQMEMKRLAHVARS